MNISGIKIPIDDIARIINHRKISYWVTYGLEDSFYPEDAGNRVLRNVVSDLPNHAE
jgi:hypothetical protein